MNSVVKIYPWNMVWNNSHLFGINATPRLAIYLFRLEHTVVFCKHNTNSFTVNPCCEFKTNFIGNAAFVTDHFVF